MRTIPVEKSITFQPEVMLYERAEELVRSNKTFAVSNCICRQEQRILGKGCDKPEESCLQFGIAAQGVVSMDRGRAISREEALAILNRAEEAGLVLQPANAKDPLFICTCCGCCCGVLRSIKRFPVPASLVAGPFFGATECLHMQGVRSLYKAMSNGSPSYGRQEHHPESGSVHRVWTVRQHLSH